MPTSASSARARSRSSRSRPEKRNALSLEMMRELERRLRDLGATRRARRRPARRGARRSAPATICASCVDRDVDAYRTIFDACVDLMARIVAIPQPVIAEVARVATAAGLPARRRLRSGGRLDRGDVCDAGRSHRALLQHADGRADARDRTQACDGDAADRRSDRRANGAGLGPGQPRRCRPSACTPRRSRSRGRSRRRAAPSWGSARRHFTHRSISITARRTRTRKT